MRSILQKSLKSIFVWFYSVMLISVLFQPKLKFELCMINTFSDVNVSTLKESNFAFIEELQNKKCDFSKFFPIVEKQWKNLRKNLLIASH